MNINRTLKKLKRIFYKIKWWIKLDAKYTHKYLIQGVKNLWRWFPIIWKDRDWDDYYIWILLEKKLTYQAKYIGGRGIHLDANRDAERMMTCVRLIQKIKEEYYESEFHDYIKNEFHWDDIPDKPDYKQLRIEEISENLDDYFKKYPLIYRQVTKAEKLKKYHIALRMSRINHKRAKNLLFKILNEHIESWWD